MINWMPAHGVRVCWWGRLPSAWDTAQSLLSPVKQPGCLCWFIPPHLQHESIYSMKKKVHNKQANTTTTTRLRGLKWTQHYSDLICNPRKGWVSQGHETSQEISTRSKRASWFSASLTPSTNLFHYSTSPGPAEEGRFPGRLMCHLAVIVIMLFDHRARVVLEGHVQTQRHSRFDWGVGRSPATSLLVVLGIRQKCRAGLFWLSVGGRPSQQRRTIKWNLRTSPQPTWKVFYVLLRWLMRLVPARNAYWLGDLPLPGDDAMKLTNLS